MGREEVKGIMIACFLLPASGEDVKT
jgi:hypothetical protein